MHVALSCGFVCGLNHYKIHIVSLNCTVGKKYEAFGISLHIKGLDQCFNKS